MSQTLLAIYDATTGQILRRVSCHESVAAMQAGDGQAVHVVPRGTAFDDTTHFIDLSGPAPVLKPKPE